MKEDVFMDLSIKLTSDEKLIAENYEKANSITLEDANDIKAYEKAYKEYIDSGKKSISFENVWKEFGL